jgi:UPF0755 protein
MVNNSRKKIFQIVLIVVSLFVVLGAYYGCRTYSRMLTPNVEMGEKESVFIYIPTGSSYNDVIRIMEESKVIIDIDSFKWTSSRKGYPQSIKPGKYKLKNKMSNRELVNMLRAGLQTPVRLTFTGFRTPQQLAQRVSNQIEADSAEIVTAFSSVEITSKYGFTPQTFIAMFVPNTYEFYWNTDATKFFERMKREYENFWTEERDKKEQAIGIGRIGVVTIASIIEEETNKLDERPKIAGVFLNRLNKGIALQACPTIKFALNDFTIRRVLSRHLVVNSPYNTYKYRGLPPGPINAPSITSIDAVLNYEKHDYYYFSANPDQSGSHVFTKTLAEHNRNAREYQKLLNKRKVYR